MRYEDFFLAIDPPRKGAYPVRVHSPAGDAHGTFRIPAEAEELTSRWQAMAAGEEPEPPTCVQPEEIGGCLFRALFAGDVLSRLETSLARIPDDGTHGLRLKLCLDPGHPDLAALSTLPWELLYWEERREFLTLGRRIALVRYLSVPRPVKPPLDPPLRVLLASALPMTLDLGSIQPGQESQLLRHDLDGIPGVDLQHLGYATPQKLRDKLVEQRFHVLHFMGHGDFDPQTGEGGLLFVDEHLEPLLVPGQAVADLVRDAGTLRLVFLNACETARAAGREELDPFAGVAAALVMAGVPAVLAMQLPVEDEPAIRFSRTFYRRLAAGDPLEAAAAEGRMAVRLDDSRSPSWAIPALFLRTWDGHLFAPPDDPGDATLAEIRRGAVDASGYLRSKSEGFVGRRWLFAEVERFLAAREQGYFVLRGEPGIGKTAFMARLLERHRCAHHFNVLNEGVTTPEQFLRNVRAQLVATFDLPPPALPADAGQSALFLNSLLGRVAAKLQPGEKALLLVDALDESDLGSLAPGSNALYLPVTLPPGVYVVVTTRPKAPPLRIDCVELFDLRQDSAENLGDVREYLERRLLDAGLRAYCARQGLDKEVFLVTMVDKSQGNFMYLRHVLPELERGVYQDLASDDLPGGLLSYYEDHWRRVQLQEGEIPHDAVPVLAALTASPEPISIDQIGRYSQLPDRGRIRAVLDQWAQFLYVEKERDESGRVRKRYRLYHASFSDFLRDRLDLEAANRRIADALWDEP